MKHTLEMLYHTLSCFTCIRFKSNVLLLVIEFITASPVLYRLLTLMEDWENALINKLQTHISPPPNLYLPSENSGQEAYGPALTRHKFILEAEHSPFR